jgi:serine protease
MSFSSSRFPSSSKARSSNTRFSKIRPLALAVLATVAGLTAAPAFAGKVVMSGLQSGGEYDQFIVKYRDGSVERRDVNAINRGLQRAMRVAGPSLRASAGKSAGGAAAAPNARHFRRMSLGADVVRFDRKMDRVDAETFMRQLASDPNVEYVEVDARMYQLMVPNDTSYNQQWGYFDADAGINAQAAWDSATGAGVTVAVIDTGITSHTDLNANVVAGYDFVTDATAARDGNGRDSNPADQGDWFVAGECGRTYNSNSSWHGTHVAGTVAAITNNSSGVAGTAFGAKIMPVRVLAKCGGTISDIADGITWASGGTVSGVPTLAAANVAKVLNLSLGGGGACGTTYQTAIDGAVGRGSIVVVAAGNNNTDASNNRPANCNNVVTVAAIDSSGVRSVWTAGSQESAYGSIVDIAGPGSNIYSTLNAGTTTPGAQSYASYGGTSMATPHVAGVAALVQSRRIALGQPLYTPAQLETLLKNNVRPFPIAPSSTRLIGAGIVNASASVTAAGGGGGGGSTQTYTNTADYTIGDNTTVNSPITVSGRTGSAGSTVPVAVNIVHTYIGDLKVDLIAPDGSIYTLHNRAGGSADNINQTYTVNLSTEALNGTWNLRVNDNAANDVGYINSWSITF